jgi:NitT/TauT family transport system substrate-binding protein
MRTGSLLAIALGVALGVSGSASADETLRVGKAVAGPFDFVPFDVGLAKGFFKAHGIAATEIDFDGSAKLQQGLGADAIDVGLGSGPELAFPAKGNPDRAIAVFAGPPDSQVLVVAAGGPIHTVADLKGKRVGVSTVGSLTEWLVRELSQQQGWGPDGVVPISLGSESARVAGIKTAAVDGMVIDFGTSAKMEQDGSGRNLLGFGKVAPDFIIHAIFATDKAIAVRPDALRRFLAGWFETIAWMRRNKDETVKIVAPVMNQTPVIAALAYDQVMPSFSDTGRFDPKALDVLAKSFVDMKLLPEAPNMTTLYTEALLPATK